MVRNLSRCLGLVFWGGLVWVGWTASKPLREDSDGTNVSVADYLSGPVARVSFDRPSLPLRLNDPVFARSNDSDEWQQVGYVESTAASETNKHAVIAWYSTQLPPRGFQLTHYRTSGQLDEVLLTLFPDSKREQILARLDAAMHEHGRDVSQALVPLVQQTVRESLPVIEQEFQAALQRHRPEVDRLANRFRREIVNDRLIPLARKEIVPIVRKHAERPVNQIGRELWDRASLWSFGWRALYDQSPLPTKRLVQEEWDRFVQVEAMPIFEAHMQQIVTAVQRTLTDVAANPAVRREMALLADEIARDPEAKTLMRTVLKEALLDNDRLHAVWQNVWSSPRAKEALNLASDRMEPVVRAIGDDIFGSREEGINPDFARVLRNQILGKDRSWLVARRIETDGLLLSEKPGTAMPYPVVYLASEIRQQNPTDTRPLSKSGGLSQSAGRPNE